MIYNVSILQGYTALIGSSLIHIPMLIAQLVFVRLPGEYEDYYDVFPEAPYWYVLSAFMHVILAVIHILTIFTDLKHGALYLDSARLLSVVLEVLNFILIA